MLDKCRLKYYTPHALTPSTREIRTHVAVEKTLEGLLGKVQTQVEDLLMRAPNDKAERAIQEELENIAKYIRTQDALYKKPKNETKTKYTYRIHGSGEEDARKYTVVCRRESNLRDSKTKTKKEISVNISRGLAILIGQHLGQAEFTRYTIDESLNIDVYAGANEGTIIATTEDLDKSQSQLVDLEGEILEGSKKNEVSLENLQNIAKKTQV